MKWKSTLFSALDNKLGNQIVGARWKGRGYFRAYVIPANPRTNAQKAERAVHALLVKRYQEVAPADSDARKAWDLEALPDLISGYNLFVKQGRKSKVSCQSGVQSGTIQVTYTLGLPVDRAELVVYDTVDETWEKANYTGSLESGENKTKLIGGLTSGRTYHVYIANKHVNDFDTSDLIKVASITKWKPNHSTGQADAAECEAT